MLSDRGRGFALADARACSAKARTQSESGKALKDAALHSKVETDAIFQKVKSELAADGKAQAVKKTDARAHKKLARPTATTRAKAA
jgi:hypothetical protein